MHSNKKNLLELCLSPDLGGLELYMMRASHALTETFNVLSVINTKTKLKPYYEGSVHRYRQISRKRSFSLTSARALAKIIDEEAIDVIHMHWTKDLPIAVMAKRFSRRKPKLVQTRNMTMTRFKDDFYHRFLYRNMEMILPVTHQVAEQIKRFIPEGIRPRVEVLYMGTEKQFLLDREQRMAFRQEQRMKAGFAVGMVGRIEEHKGQHLLIDAVAKLHGRGVEVDAYFVGHAMQEGYIDQLKAQAARLGVSDSVHFLGFMKEPQHFMQACDAMVLATPCETFGLVVIEAMAAKTAVIATKQCGPLEIIEDGVSGLLFDNGDADSLANKIALLVSDELLVGQMTEKALAAVEERFDTTKQFAKLATLLEEIV